MIARNAEGSESLRVMSVPVLNVCNQRGPDSFRCEINMKGYSDSVGIIGRNGAIMENVIVGEPSGFYFICAKNPSNLEFTLMQKQYILAIMVIFMTQCKLLFLMLATEQNFYGSYCFPDAE